MTCSCGTAERCHSQPSFFTFKHTHIQDFDASNRSPSTTTCDFTPVVQAPTTISVPTTPKGVGSIIAGSITGLSIVLLLLFVVFVLMLVVCIRRHRTTMKGKHNLTILVDKEEAYGDSNYIGVSDHSELSKYWYKVFRTCIDRRLLLNLFSGKQFSIWDFRC